MTHTQLSQIFAPQAFVNTEPIALSIVRLNSRANREISVLNNLILYSRYRSQILQWSTFAFGSKIFGKTH